MRWETGRHERAIPRLGPTRWPRLRQAQDQRSLESIGGSGPASSAVPEAALRRRARSETEFETALETIERVERGDELESRALRRAGGHHRAGEPAGARHRQRQLHRGALELGGARRGRRAQGDRARRPLDRPRRAAEPSEHALRRHRLHGRRWPDDDQPACRRAVRQRPRRRRPDLQAGPRLDGRPEAGGRPMPTPVHAQGRGRAHDPSLLGLRHPAGVAARGVAHAAEAAGAAAAPISRASR